MPPVPQGPQLPGGTGPLGENAQSHAQQCRRSGLMGELQLAASPEKAVEYADKAIAVDPTVPLPPAAGQCLWVCARSGQHAARADDGWRHPRCLREGRGTRRAAARPGLPCSISSLIAPVLPEVAWTSPVLCEQTASVDAAASHQMRARSLMRQKKPESAMPRSSRRWLPIRDTLHSQQHGLPGHRIKAIRHRT